MDDTPEPLSQRVIAQRRDLMLLLLNPVRVYMGINEYHELRELISAMGYLSQGECSEILKEEFMGLEVIQVARPDYLKVEGVMYEPK